MFVVFHKLASRPSSVVGEGSLSSLQTAAKVASRCVEMMGGVGFIKSTGVEKFYRDAKIGRYMYLDLFLPNCMLLNLTHICANACKSML